MKHDTVLTRLREQASNLRRKPTPLSDLIPLLQDAADVIEQLAKLEQRQEPVQDRCHLRACDQSTGREFFVREGLREELQAEADRMNAAGHDYFVWPPAPTTPAQEPVELEVKLEQAGPVAVHDKDQPNGIAWCPGYPEKLEDITALYTTPQPTALLDQRLVPVQGWKLVPVEPTPEMMKAAVIYANGNAVYKNVAAAVLEIEECIYGEVYASMLNAAPTTPAQEDKQ
jgi:hypothetical protein